MTSGSRTHRQSLVMEAWPCGGLRAVVAPLRRAIRLSGVGLALALVCASALADVKPLPRSEWPTTVAAAVPLIVAALTPAQRSIVVATSRDSLRTLQGEWGEDIETMLGLHAGNAALVAAVCGDGCSVDHATLLLMEAAWDALRK